MKNEHARDACYSKYVTPQILPTVNDLKYEEECNNDLSNTTGNKRCHETVSHTEYSHQNRLNQIDSNERIASLGSMDHSVHSMIKHNNTNETGVASAEHTQQSRMKLVDADAGVTDTDSLDSVEILTDENFCTKG